MGERLQRMFTCLCVITLIIPQCRMQTKFTTNPSYSQVTSSSSGPLSTTFSSTTMDWTNRSTPWRSQSPALSFNVTTTLPTMSTTMSETPSPTSKSQTAFLPTSVSSTISSSMSKATIESTISKSTLMTEKGSTSFPTVTTSPVVKDDKNIRSNFMVIIIAAVAGGVLLSVVVIASLVITKCRKRKSADLKNDREKRMAVCSSLPDLMSEQTSESLMQNRGENGLDIFSPSLLDFKDEVSSHQVRNSRECTRSSSFYAPPPDVNPRLRPPRGAPKRALSLPNPYQLVQGVHVAKSMDAAYEKGTTKIGTADSGGDGYVILRGYRTFSDECPEPEPDEDENGYVLPTSYRHLRLQQEEEEDRYCVPHYYANDTVMVEIVEGEVEEDEGGYMVPNVLLNR